MRLLDEYHPRNILEFNFGQTTKITAQYAVENNSGLTVLDHNRNRVEHLMRSWSVKWNGTNVYTSKLLKVCERGMEGWAFNNFSKLMDGKRYNLILLKCPFGLGKTSALHVDLSIYLTTIIDKDFAVLMDHVEEENGARGFMEMVKLLENAGIAYVRKEFLSPGRRVGLLASETWRYVEEY